MLLLFCSTYFLVNGKSCTKVKAVAFIRRLYSKIEKDVGYKALQKYYDKWSIRPLKQTVRDAISSHNLREVFRQQLKVDGIDTVFRITPAGRIYGVTFIDHTNGIVANGSVLGREFSARVFNELFPTSRKEDQHAERKHDPQNHTHTANPVSGVVDTLLDLADARAFEEQQRIQRRRRKRRL